MPVKLRLVKAKAHRVTPEAIAAFDRGYRMGLHRVLGLKPWQPSPFDIDGATPPAWSRAGPWRDDWALVATLRAELEAGAHRH